FRHISRRATAVTFGSCCRAVARAFIRATRLDSHLRHPCNAGRHAPENNDKSYGETAMFRQNRIGLALGLMAAALLLGTPSGALAQGKKIKIGVVYDYSGPLAAGGSELHGLGTKIMIDYFNQKGGVEGYQIEPVYADAQSKPDVAINEAIRLIEQEKVDIVLGFYSSAQCVPVASRVDQVKKFMWITTCISSAVLEGKHLKYVFRPQPSGKQFGFASTGFI